jgi:hypothetical protein
MCLPFAGCFYLNISQVIHTQVYQYISPLHYFFFSPSFSPLRSHLTTAGLMGCENKLE